MASDVVSCAMCINQESPHPPPPHPPSLVPLQNLAPDVLEMFDLLFTSDPAAAVSTWEEIPAHSVFCVDCVNLLQQLKTSSDQLVGLQQRGRSKIQLNAIHDQIERVVDQIKSNYVAKLNQNNNNDEPVKDVTGGGDDDDDSVNFST